MLAIVLSAGLPPVRVPQLAGQTTAGARALLARAGLRSAIHLIIAPGVPAGTVTSQLPAPSVRVPRGAAVALDLAETPHWQPVTTLSGGDRTVTAAVSLRGSQWRIVYTMAYRGTCTLIVFCSGPTATVTGSGGASRSFGLPDGGRQTQTFAAGPGRFTLSVAPGSDSARWTAWAEDWY